MFNKENLPYALIANLETSLADGHADDFQSKISSALAVTLNGFTPDQDADSAYYWEPEGCHGWFKNLNDIEHEFKVVDTDENWVVLETIAYISVEAEGEFSLSVYDSVDKEYIPMASIGVTAEESFESEILITISGDLNGPLSVLVIDEVEIVKPIGSIHFGTLKPDWGGEDEWQ